MIRLKEDWYDDWGLERPDDVPDPKDIKLYDVVRCAGYDWYVIDKQGDVVTLLAKDADFEVCRFDEESNDYKNSEIRRYLNNEVLPILERWLNPIPTRLDDVGVTDKVWLLSIDEAEGLPREIRPFNKWWWLRSRGRDSNHAANVDTDGSVGTYGFHVFNASGCVRPAMRVKIEDLD